MRKRGRAKSRARARKIRIPVHSQMLPADDCCVASPPSAAAAASSAAGSACPKKRARNTAFDDQEDSKVAAPSLRAEIAVVAAAASSTAAVINVFSAAFYDNSTESEESLAASSSCARYGRTKHGVDCFVDALWEFYVREVGALLGPTEHKACVRRACFASMDGGGGTGSRTFAIDRRAPLLCALDSRCSVDEQACRQVMFVDDFNDFKAMPLWHLTQHARHMPPVLLELQVCVIDVATAAWNDRSLRFLADRNLDAPHHWICPFIDHCLSLVAEARRRSGIYRAKDNEDDLDFELSSEEAVKAEAMQLAYRMLGVRPAEITWAKSDDEAN
jgi:hypothetical protein